MIVKEKTPFHRKMLVRNRQVMSVNIMTADAMVKLFEETKNPSRELYELMAAHHDALTRECVARSALCPPDILARLANDPDTTVITCVAKNAATPLSNLQSLLCSQDIDIVVACCCNPSLSADDKRHMLRWLPDKEVHKIAQYGGMLDDGTLTLLVENGNDHTRELVAKRTDLPLDLLERLACDVDTNVRAATLYSPHITATLIEQLNDDEDPWVRAHVACAGKLSTAQVIERSTHESDIYREYLAERHTEPLVLSHLFYTDCADSAPNTNHFHADNMMLALAYNHATPGAILQRLYALNGSYKMHWRLCRNDSINGQLLCQLAFGSVNETIREYGRARVMKQTSVDWAKFVADGLTLDYPMTFEHDHHQTVRLGDHLLKIGLSDTYQHIQALTLRQQIDISTSHSSQVPNQLVHRPLKPRI